MRNSFAKEITKLAGRNKNIVMIMADIGNHLFDEYKYLYPNRFLNCGIAESNMISMASGLSSCGFKSVCYTITPFITLRCLEQIRIDVCYHNIPVIIVGTGSGLSYASLGATHHSCEDISIMRSIPNIQILCPGDSMEVKSCLREAINSNYPTYIRIGKKNEEVIHKTLPIIKIGKNIIIKKGKNIVLMSTGNVLPVSIEVHKLLQTKGINCEVVSCHTIKPIDKEYIKKALSKFKIIVLIEEHSSIGGLGSSIAEYLMSNNFKNYNEIVHFSIKDKFLKQCVNQYLARRHFSIDANEIYNFIMKKLY